MTQIGATAALAMLVWVMWGFPPRVRLDPDEGIMGLFISGGSYFLAGMDACNDGGDLHRRSHQRICLRQFPDDLRRHHRCADSGCDGGADEVQRGDGCSSPIWLTIVYFPIAHMVWAGGGLLFEDGALDFAGGTVVHINAGVSGLVLAYLLGKRRGYPAEPMPPHSMIMTMIGTGLLWVGWFGFNAGSALEADGFAGLAMINTFVATAAGALTWMVIERLVGHKGSALGFCSGVIAGLVAVTPAAGNSRTVRRDPARHRRPRSSATSLVAKVKAKFGYDDSLDAFGIHGVGGIVGAIGTGIVYQPFLGGPGDGSTALGAHSSGSRSKSVLITIGWAGVGTFIAALIVKTLIGLRVAEEAEVDGLDISEHGERAYN